MQVRPISVTVFTLCAISPIVLLLLAGAWGGGWVWLALLQMAFVPVAFDSLNPQIAADAPEPAEFPAADALLVAIGVGHLLALPLLTFAVAGGSGLSVPQRVALFVAAGLWFGQVAHPAAHELIHRSPRRLRALGVAIYTTLMFGHHASAHRLVHHRAVGTQGDPNTARRGEGYYHYAPRAWVGSFRLGLRAETRRRQGQPGTLHPYLIYTIGAAASLIAAYLCAAGPGVLVWAGFGLHATSQILISDYVQHYGLSRHPEPGRNYEPVSAAHSWNAGQWFTTAMMLNAPRHSDHHVHPQRPYPALQLPDPAVAPRLPWPLPLACMIALYPPYWHRRMAPLMPRQKPPVAGL